MLIVDGRQGEGGGQLLRTSLSLSALTGRPCRLVNIRAGRSKPGLRPQHLTAVRAVAALCGAHLSGDDINAQTLEFRPQHAPQGGTYLFDVNEAAPHGSAGSVSLILQAVLWPLLFADTGSTVVLRGGTHVPFSPPFHYIQHVARPAFQRLGAHLQVELDEWGWMPRGGGQITAVVEPVTHLQAATWTPQPVEAVQGLAVVTNLPGHIPHRMSRRAYNLITEAGLHAAVQALRATSHAPGTGLFLWLDSGQAGFSCLGRKGLPAQTVAERAVEEVLTFAQSETAVDYHLADQVLIPMALAHGTSRYTTNTLTRHTLTNAALLRQWLDVTIEIDGQLEGPGEVSVTGVGFENSWASA